MKPTCAIKTLFAHLVLGGRGKGGRGKWIEERGLSKVNREKWIEERGLSKEDRGYGVRGKETFECSQICEGKGLSQRIPMREWREPLSPVLLVEDDDDY